MRRADKARKKGGQMENRGGSFVTVRRIAPSPGRGNAYRSTSAVSSVRAQAVAGSATWLGRGFSCVCAQGRELEEPPSFDLTPAQEECLQRLQNRVEITYDSSAPEHQEALKSLWDAAFPDEELQGLKSEQWKVMGWQGNDPSTDFRGGGFISLENLLYFARKFPKCFQELLLKREGDRSLWEYPFAVAGVNITFMLIQMLDLEAAKPRTIAGATFLKFLSENESAFDLLFCIAFKLMDDHWLSMHASYMDFNTVMKATDDNWKESSCLIMSNDWKTCHATAFLRHSSFSQQLGNMKLFRRKNSHCCSPRPSRHFSLAFRMIRPSKLCLTC